ncbi:conserved protein of unknown function [Paraburkholderia dioscoreae]|uniref:Uncharacterized protein n=1 Tax=Paraburkholderia dioscoreae TaxID=2604047 RepID=A0A5Q4ZB01_9BURK|nr:conserved protein of unknown function [Paraburkholderia dioscoreae]VVD28111.1 conserved protein of unknown function [Paraburkholderia dioscoreae]
MALRARKSQGGAPRPVGGVNPAHPVRLLRSGCGRGAAFAPCSQPASPSAPRGLPQCAVTA